MAGNCQSGHRRGVLLLLARRALRSAQIAGRAGRRLSSSSCMPNLLPHSLHNAWDAGGFLCDEQAAECVFGAASFLPHRAARRPLVQCRICYPCGVTDERTAHEVSHRIRHPRLRRTGRSASSAPSGRSSPTASCCSATCSTTGRVTTSRATTRQARHRPAERPRRGGRSSPCAATARPRSTRWCSRFRAWPTTPSRWSRRPAGRSSAPMATCSERGSTTASTTSRLGGGFGGRLRPHARQSERGCGCPAWYLGVQPGQRVYPQGWIA